MANYSKRNSKKTEKAAPEVKAPVINKESSIEEQMAFLQAQLDKTELKINKTLTEGIHQVIFKSAGIVVHGNKVKMDIIVELDGVECTPDSHDPFSGQLDIFFSKLKLIGDQCGYSGQIAYKELTEACVGKTITITVTKTEAGYYNRAYYKPREAKTETLG